MKGWKELLCVSRTEQCKAGRTMHKWWVASSWVSNKQLYCTKNYEKCEGSYPYHCLISADVWVKYLWLDIFHLAVPRCSGSSRILSQRCWKVDSSVYVHRFPVYYIYTHIFFCVLLFYSTEVCKNEPMLTSSLWTTVNPFLAGACCHFFKSLQSYILQYFIGTWERYCTTCWTLNTKDFMLTFQFR